MKEKVIIELGLRNCEALLVFAVTRVSSDRNTLVYSGLHIYGVRIYLLTLALYVGYYLSWCFSYCFCLRAYHYPFQVCLFVCLYS